LNIGNVEFQKGDIFNMDFEDGLFDHILVCFVLEHLPRPIDALKALKRVCKKGGSITVIEGDHGSAYFHPESDFAKRVINAQVRLQAEGGNALIGRQLFPLLKDSGFENCKVHPKTVYVDSSRPELVEGFTKNTFTAMIEGVRENAVKNLLMDENDFDRGIRDLYRTTENDGVFCYTFFKGTGRNS
jgi:ubiquinone/menaquinone biosynthesis C-methylase UbiE